MQVEVSFQNQNLCVRTGDGWPNGFASRLASSRKSHEVINFTHINMTCVVVRVPFVRKRTSGPLRTNLSSIKVNASQHKWVAKRNASWTQVKNLRWLASRFGLTDVTTNVGKQIKIKTTTKTDTDTDTGTDTGTGAGTDTDTEVQTQRQRGTNTSPNLSTSPNTNTITWTWGKTIRTEKCVGTQSCNAVHSRDDINKHRVASSVYLAMSFT